MDLLVALLKTNDNQLKSSLRNCRDNHEAWTILKSVEKNLDESINSLEMQVDGQKLLNELHRYNLMKDSAQAVIGSLANLQGVTVAELHRSFNVDLDS